jgi:hypothetical protein
MPEAFKEKEKPKSTVIEDIKKTAKEWFGLGSLIPKKKNIEWTDKDQRELDKKMGNAFANEKTK